MKKLWRVLCFCLIVACSWFFLGCDNVEAAQEYDTISFYKEMKIGTKQFCNSNITWTLGGTSHEIDLDDVTSFVSDNEAIVKAWIEQYTYGQWLYVEAVAKGTAKVTLTVDETVLEIPFRVLDYNEGRIGICLEDKTMKKGDEMRFDSVNDYYVTWGNVEKYTDKEDFIITSSDESVVKVEYDYFSDGELYRIILHALKAGTAKISVKIETSDEDKSDVNGITDSFLVTVMEDPKVATPKPTLLSQIQLSKKYEDYFVSQDSIMFGFNLLEGNIRYEFYMSPYKNKGFKKVGWAEAELWSDGHMVELSDDDYAYDIEAGEFLRIDINRYNKKKLKANKKYYIKARAKYTDSNGTWSKWSKVQEYWTAPAAIKNSKVKFNKKTQKVTIPKVKGANGYIYTAWSSQYIGRNIFGKKLYDTYEESRITSKRNFKVKKLSKECRLKPQKVQSVYPYIKRNGYYYCDGYNLTKSYSKFKREVMR